MKMAMTAAAVVLAAALPAAAQKPHDGDERTFLELLPRAVVVGVAAVDGTDLRPAAGGGAEPKAWTVALRPQRDLYGAAGGKTLAIGVPTKPQLKAGDRALFALDGSHKLGGAVAVRWTQGREQAAKHALAPGWQWSRGRFLCPWCRVKKVAAGIGKCSVCGAATASGAFKLCRKHAATSGRCMMCERKVGPVTAKTTLRLGTINPRLRMRDPLRIDVQAGKDVHLWAHVITEAKSLTEFQCVGGKKDLLGCTTLFFLVTPPGADAKIRAVGFQRAAAGRSPDGKRNVALAAGRTAPLTGATFSRLKLRRNGLDATPIFDKPGPHVVRAVAGRHISNPVTVVVRGRTAGGDVPRPIPPGAANVPIFTPGEKTVEAHREGKIVWKLRLNFPVGTVEVRGRQWVIQAADGSATATIDAATGKMLSIRRR